jgi:2-phosphoglycerate kinase
MVWDPSRTLKKVLWIGGAQWAGKSTVAYLLATRYGLTAYHYDYHDARAHDDRRLARRVRNGEPVETPFNEAYWQDTPPTEMAAITLAGFPIRFEWVLDDLRALTVGRPIIAEGWGLRPELVLPIVDSPGRMVMMIPTEAFRQHQLRTVSRTGPGSFVGRCSDPERAHHNRLERDRLIAEDAARSAREHGVRLIEVDGSIGAEGVADLLADHFSPYLPT